MLCLRKCINSSMYAYQSEERCLLFIQARYVQIRASSVSLRSDRGWANLPLKATICDGVGPRVLMPNQELGRVNGSSVNEIHCSFEPKSHHVADLDVGEVSCKAELRGRSYAGKLGPTTTTSS